MAYAIVHTPIEVALDLARAYERSQAQKALRAHEARQRRAFTQARFDEAWFDKLAPTLAEHAARLANI